MSFDEFKILIQKRILEDYPFSKTKDNHILIVRGQSSVKIIISELYHKYHQRHDIDMIYHDLKGLIEKTFDERVKTQEVNWNNVYPVFKHPSFDNKHCLKTIKAFTLDLSTFLVEKGNGIVEILTDQQAGNVDSAYELAFDNLRRVPIEVNRILPDYEIYAVNTHFPFASSLILDGRLPKELNRHIRKDFIFAIPGLSTLIVAKDHPDYYPMIESLINKCEDPNRITESIYRFQKGEYNYAVRKHQLRVVK